MKQSFSDINEKLFSSCEISSIGAVGTMSLLHGKMAKFFNFIGRALAYTSTRSYGCFLLSFGIAALLLNFGEVYFKEQTVISVSTLVICGIILLISIPLLIFDRPMCIAFQDFAPTDKLLFEFLSIKRMRRNVLHASVHPAAALVIGLIPATLSFLFSMKTVILVLIALVIVSVAFATPEFLMILSLLFAPYLLFLEHGGVFFAILSLVTFLSFILKVILGKRVFHLSLPDAVFFLFMLSVLVFGLLSDTDTIDVLITSSLLLCYFPISNLIVNRRLAECAKSAVVISVLPVALSAVVKFIIIKVGNVTDGEPSAFFDSSAALTAFMLAGCAATFVYAIERAQRWKRILCFSFFVVEIAAVTMTLRPESIIVFLLSLLAYPILKSRFVPIDVLALLLLLPYVLMFIPDVALDAVSDLFGLSVPLSVSFSSYRSMLSEFFDNVWIGAPAEAPIGANTPLGIALGYGICSVLLFAVLIVLKLRHISYFRLYTRNSILGATGEMTSLSMITLLLYGAYYNIFADCTVLFVFVAMFGISAAVLRTAKQEYDDRMGYYDDSKSSESSALDVGINHYNR